MIAIKGLMISTKMTMMIMMTTLMISDNELWKPKDGLWDGLHENCSELTDPELIAQCCSIFAPLVRARDITWPVTSSRKANVVVHFMYSVCESHQRGNIVQNSLQALVWCNMTTDETNGYQVTFALRRLINTLTYLLTNHVMFSTHE